MGQSKTLPGRPRLQSPVPNVYTFGSKTPLSVLGFFNTDIGYKSKTTWAKFYMLESDTCITFLSNNTTQQIQLTHLTGSATIPVKFPALFDGSMGHTKNIQIKLHINPSLPPVAQKHQRFLFHIHKDVGKDLDRLEKMDVIEKVQNPTPLYKPNCSHSKEIRWCKCLLT